MKFLNNQYILFTFRCLLAVVFIFSGVEKIAEPAAFAASILNYKLLPEISVNLAGILLPWIELSAGLLLLFGVNVRENAFIISSLLVIFTLAIGISVARGLNIDCGCFGTSGGTKVGFLKIGENLLLAAIGVLLIIYDSNYLTLPGSSHNRNKDL